MSKTCKNRETIETYVQKLQEQRNYRNICPKTARTEKQKKHISKNCKNREPIETYIQKLQEQRNYRNIYPKTARTEKL